jgi:hypothetical protein
MMGVMASRKLALVLALEPKSLAIKGFVSITLDTGWLPAD